MAIPIVSIVGKSSAGVRQYLADIGEGRAGLLPDAAGHGFARRRILPGMAAHVNPAVSAEEHRRAVRGQRLELRRPLLRRYARDDVDVFVAGGGPAGVAAALSASRQGARVFLAEGTSCFGGMGTAGLVPAFMCFSDGLHFLAAGIGEEIMFRMFVLGLWAFLINLILRRWRATKLALWIANVIAALAFAAGHLPAAMMLLGVTTPDALPPVVLVELFLLNGIVAIVAGERYMRDGLVAAAGVHFWADVVWHVIFPLVAA